MKTVKLTVERYKGTEFEKIFIFTGATKKEVIAQHQATRGWMCKDENTNYIWELTEETKNPK